jgi:hypothetical protein
MLPEVAVANDHRNYNKSAYLSILSRYSQQKTLDKIFEVVIIIFTVCQKLKRDEDESATSEKQPRQAENPTAMRNLQPASARCDPSIVSEQRVLRCPRLGPGEVRDAATGPCGQAAGFPNGQGIWFLTAIVLPSRIHFRAKRLVRIASREAWSEKRSQAHSGSNEIRSPTAGRAAVAEFRSAGGSSETELQPSGASPQHRAAASAGKKTPVSMPSPSTPASSDEDQLVAAYEELRRQFVNGQRGPGLALFIRRGMRELMNICSICAAPPPTEVLAEADGDAVLSQGVRTEVVLILAGMLMHSCQEARS